MPDLRNRLVKFAAYDDSQALVKEVWYRYDAADQLVHREEGHAYTSGSPGSTTDEYFVHEAGRRVLTVADPTDDDGDVSRRYGHGPTGELLFDQVFSAAGAETDLLSVLGDHQHSTRLVLEESMAVRQSVDYDAFGEVNEIRDSGGALVQSGGEPDLSALETAFAHHGSLLEAQTGLHLKAHRWYDPASGKFISEDPAGHLDSPNLYRFAGNDPVNYADPTGLSQSGHPFEGFAQDTAFGGYSGGRVHRPAKVDNSAGQAVQNVLGALGTSAINAYGNRLEASVGALAGFGQRLASFDYSQYFAERARYDDLSMQFHRVQADLTAAKKSLSQRSFYELFDQSADRRRINILEQRRELLAGFQSTARDNFTQLAHSAFDGRHSFQFQFNGTQYASVSRAFDSGLRTGGKAVGNAAASAASLGFYDGPFQLTQRDIDKGYNASRLIAGASTELLAGLATGGLARTRGFLGKSALAFDASANALGIGRGFIDVSQNGLYLGNSLAIVGGAAGLSGNLAAGREAFDGIVGGAHRLASNASSLRVSFDPATLSAGGLGGVKINLNTNTAVGNFGVYELTVKNELYKIGKADLQRVTKSTGLATRIHQQVRILEKSYGPGSVRVGAVTDLGTTTTARAKLYELQQLRRLYETKGVIPLGNQKSFKPGS